MDIRGIEVTNQLRSAIRAKLLELGVRYDEELPDYILVMVVNKKSRQQMHEDLYLFLEDCTTPFVSWLHDQVLKKLQKVTVAKKKSSREFVPTVVVKQEEERKKKKSCTTSFLEDQTLEVSGDKASIKNVKDDKSFHKQSTKSSVSGQKTDISQIKGVEKYIKPAAEGRSDTPPTYSAHPDNHLKKSQQPNDQSSSVAKETTVPDIPNNKSTEVHHETKASDALTKSLKRSLDVTTNYRESLERKHNEAKRSKVAETAEPIVEDSTKKLKSCVNKPKITSVVSVKNRLGIVSPRKKFETYRDKAENEARHRLSEKRFEKHRFDLNRGGNFQRGRNFDNDDRSKRNKEPELKHGEVEKITDVKNRLGSNKGEKTSKPGELKEKINLNTKLKTPEKLTGSVKDRLGISNINKTQKQSTIKVQEMVDYRNFKSIEHDRDGIGNNKNIKNRLGPVKNNFKPVTGKSSFNTVLKRSRNSDDDNCLKLEEEEEIDDNVESIGNTGPIKSHIVAVNKPLSLKTDRKRLKPLEKLNKEGSSDAEEEDEDPKLPSKVIVTPRPLKPLQPTQKRATQSLLLRAVAEANQSVVTQKNPEPCLLDKKPALKRLKPAVARDVGQNLSVHLNANKRLVMEKIQVELNTIDVPDAEPKPYVPQSVTEEDMGVVMSLFQRSDDNQKFLVTLNGYNNNMAKDKIASDEDERLEMEVNEDDELALLTTQNDAYAQNEGESAIFTTNNSDIEASVKEGTEENNENCNTENVDKTEEIPRKRRKLSPIVYNRSHSPSPVESKPTTSLTTATVTKRTDKRPSAEVASTVVDKSREKCRYWPNCTLGNKCAYLHPPVMCSAFPACKYGDKCAYRHPKCKFGLSCTKLGCVFSHPAQQCKYHPFCTKPACPFSHPASHTTLSVEATTQRAKFTWRRRD